MAFTTFAFDGLKRKRRSGSKRRRSSSLRGLGRIRRGSTRPKEQVCGCKVVMLPRGKRGGGKTGKMQPALACPGSPMKRYIKHSDVAKYRGKRVCTWMVKPIR